VANQPTNEYVIVLDEQGPITIDLPPPENSEDRRFTIKNALPPLEQATKEQNPTLPERSVFVNVPGSPIPLSPSESVTLVVKRDGEWGAVE
jgi:hypothetical protein